MQKRYFNCYISFEKESGFSDKVKVIFYKIVDIFSTHCKWKIYGENLEKKSPKKYLFLTVVGSCISAYQLAGIQIY